MAHVAGLVAAGVYPNPLPHAHVVTSTTHKTLRGPRGGIIVAKGATRGAGEEAAVHRLPGHPGRSADARHRGQGGRLQGSAGAGFKAYQQQVVKNAQAMANTIIARGYKIVSGGTQNHLMLVDMIGKDITGKDAEAALGQAHITVNKNAVPNDPRAVRDLGPAPRHAGGHHARLPGSRLRGAGQLDRRRARRPGRRGT